MMRDCCCSCFFCSLTGDRICAFLRDYDRLQSLAVSLIYLQIACALVGSLAASYNGVLLINLSIALFALVAIVSSSQSLVRTYAVLLVCAMLLDISWFILFSHDICFTTVSKWLASTSYRTLISLVMNSYHGQISLVLLSALMACHGEWVISSDDYGAFYIFSVKLALVMEIIGFSVRLFSSLLWIQMYRLGVSNVDSAYPNIPDDDLRNTLLSPTATANVDEVLGGSIYDPTYYSSLFEDSHDVEHLNRIHQTASGEGFSSLATEKSQSRPSPGSSVRAVKVDISRAKPQNHISKTNSV